MNLRGTRSFDRTSPVLEYWLARCRGFEVRRGRHLVGIVEEVGCTGPEVRAELLAVRPRRFYRRRRQLFPASEVAAIVPAQRLLVLDRKPSRERVALGRGSRALVRGSRRGFALARPLVVRATVALAAALWLLLVLTLRLLRWTAPRAWWALRRGARLARAGAVRAAPVVRRAGRRALLAAVACAGKCRAAVARYLRAREAPHGESRSAP
jgi:hypothetical protein